MGRGEGLFYLGEEDYVFMKRRGPRHYRLLLQDAIEVPKVCAGVDRDSLSFAPGWVSKHLFMDSFSETAFGIDPGNRLRAGSVWDTARPPLYSTRVEGHYRK